MLLSGWVRREPSRLWSKDGIGFWLANVWVLRDIDEARVSALASALAQAGKRLMPEDPWN